MSVSHNHIFDILKKLLIEPLLIVLNYMYYFINLPSHAYRRRMRLYIVFPSTYLYTTCFIWFYNYHLKSTTHMSPGDILTRYKKTNKLSQVLFCNLLLYVCRNPVVKVLRRDYMTVYTYFYIKVFMSNVVTSLLSKLCWLYRKASLDQCTHWQVTLQDIDNFFTLST